MATGRGKSFLTRRKFLSRLGGGAAAALGALSYAHWVEPHWLEVSQLGVPAPSRPTALPPVRLLHLSDLHASPEVSFDQIAAALAAGIRLQPDLIAITGDFFTDRLEGAFRYAEILARLSKIAPPFACLGNHDGGTWTQRFGGYSTTREVRTLLDAAGITCLHNTAETVSVREQKIQLIGVGDLWSGDCLPRLAFAHAGARTGERRIVLNHNPDAKNLLLPFDWDLMLSGHTHGGQLRLPLIGTPFAPVEDKRFVEGLHAWEGRWLHVSRGVGNLLGLRFNCRPQISLLTLA